LCNFNPKSDTQQKPEQENVKDQKKVKQSVNSDRKKVSIEDPYALLMVVSISQMLQ